MQNSLFHNVRRCFLSTMQCSRMTLRKPLLIKLILCLVLPCVLQQVHAQNETMVIEETPTSVTILRPTPKTESAAETQQEVVVMQSSYDWRKYRHTINLTIGTSPAIFTPFFPVMTPVNDIMQTTPRMFCGTYSLGYDCNLLRWLSVGAKVSGELWQIKNRMVGKCNIVARMDFSYLNMRYVRLYSGFEFGASLFLYDGCCFPLPAFSVTPIGVQAGGARVYAMTELNFGTSDIIRAGVGVRL